MTVSIVIPARYGSSRYRGKPLVKILNREMILRVADIFRAKVVDVGTKSYALEITGSKDKLEAFVEILRPLGLKEINRTGLIALKREKN